MIDDPWEQQFSGFRITATQNTHSAVGQVGGTINSISIATYNSQNDFSIFTVFRLTDCNDNIPERTDFKLDAYFNYEKELYWEDSIITVWKLVNYTVYCCLLTVYTIVFFSRKLNSNVRVH